MQPTGTEPLLPDDPREIGPYRLLGRLGEGGMGTVYLASGDTGRLVAIKVIRAGYASDSFAARFHAEVTHARRVASFCTAQVLEDGMTGDGRPYMVTEYIPGTPLSQQINRNGALDPGQLHGVAIGVATALAAIHVAGLVHRDLKPANVILSMSGPRVIDFGIARALDATSGPTQAGEVVGSPGWWAPEQITGAEIGPWTDIFAWGCLISYASTGRHPYGHGDAPLLAARVLNTTPDLGDLPSPLHDLVRRATTHDPTTRPTAQDLMLTLIGSTLPTRAPTPTPAPTPSPAQEPPTQEPPTQVQAPTPTAVLPPTLEASPSHGTPTFEARPSSGPPTPEPPASRRRPIAIAAVVAALIVTAIIVITVLNRPNGEPPAADGVTTAAVGEWAIIGTTGFRIKITEPPACGSTSYNDTESTIGHFCLIKWTLQNDGPDSPVESNPVTLTDDDGLEHAATDLSDPAPESLSSGDSVEGTLVFDIPTNRTPTAVLFENDTVKITL
ncbi:hypothetical protein Acor_79090 [Acrocarpospora corrugata]|uniref:Protein kinase domain-containing protein n=1 Tax=Acrocarpospora corrugata TaxID=35763 RepID=A0A5M3WC66_9ACTN|nr:serine/threonine-protein kinase [Acrocarpospora corrugata]GES05840.1 hypothetical protein Acor_79090 [Acrocarpospora corrugata]